jgi:hypothetical protein
VFCWGWWRGLRPYYTLKLEASQRLIVGWLAHLQILSETNGQVLIVRSDLPYTKRSGDMVYTFWLD